jgi:NAD-dependent oxidoreductase involved in siderophore biosynthesis
LFDIHASAKPTDIYQWCSQMTVSPQSSPVRVGVAGAGVFGGNHAKKLAANSKATLVGIYDHTLERAQALADSFGVEGFDDLNALLEKIDALVVAPRRGRACGD